MTTSTQTIQKGYKQTEIGVIPADWDMKKLGDCLVRSPRYGIGAAAVEYSDRLPKYIRITDISDDGRYSPEKPVSVNNIFSDNYFLSDGDLVVARTGASVGKSYLYRPKDGPLVFAGFLICLIADRNILTPQYLEAYLKTTSYWNWVKVTSMRSGQPGINGNEYARLLIPLPEIAEQRIINKALSETDTLIEDLGKLIEKKRNIKQGAMQALLTGKRRLPEFSTKWEVKKLGDFFSLSASYSKSKFINDGGDYLIMDMGSISSNGKNIASKRTFLSTDLLQTGDLVMPKDDIGGGNIIGKVAYVDCDNKYILGDHVYKLTAKNPEKISTLFFSYLINSSTVSIKLKKKVAGSAQLGLGRKSVEDQDIDFPKDRDEQTAIATVLSDMDTEIEKLESQLAKYQNFKQGMMQSLLTGKIRLLTK